MKFSVQEEHGLRCLLRIAENYETKQGITIPEISEAERLTPHTTAKILRQLRIAGFLESERGQSGGYTLAKPPDKIMIGEVFDALGGRLFDEDFCKTRAGNTSICTHSIDCSLRSLWYIIQKAVDDVTVNLSLKDLMKSEDELLKELFENKS